MGVLNVTPDSFYDGGRHATADAAIAHGRALLAEGADWLDVGGESTRPGATTVSADEECARVLPVLAALRNETERPLSIDTMKAAVAAAALAAGADVVNDVSGGSADPGLLPAAAAAGAAVVLGHIQGTPATMQAAPAYGDVVAEVAAFLRTRAAAAAAAGVAPDAILVDPGIGFGKRPEHNLALLAGLATVVADGRPVVVGVSRKRFLGLLTGAAVEDRLASSLAAAVLAARAGARVVRAHDVAATRQALAVADAIARAAC
jgi:dihydropteroate synthase